MTDEWSFARTSGQQARPVRPLPLSFVRAFFDVLASSTQLLAWQLLFCGLVLPFLMSLAVLFDTESFRTTWGPLAWAMCAAALALSGVMGLVHIGAQWVRSTLAWRAAQASAAVARPPMYERYTLGSTPRHEASRALTVVSATALICGVSMWPIVAPMYPSLLVALIGVSVAAGVLLIASWYARTGESARLEEARAAITPHWPKDTVPRTFMNTPQQRRLWKRRVLPSLFFPRSRC